MKRLDDSGSSDIKESEARVAAFVKDLERLLEKKLRAILKGLEEGETKAIEAAATLGKLHESLMAGGLAKELDKINTLYAGELKQISKALAAYTKSGGVVYSNADLKLATTLIDFDTSLVEDKIRLTEDSLRSAIMKRIITGGTPDIDPMLAEALPRLTSQVETELRTGTKGFNQAITNAKAEEYGLDLWVYLGPEDEITRDFCRELIEDGRVFTTEEVAAMVNPETPELPVDVYGGGYNCRHRWRPITLNAAREDYGYNG